MVEVIERREMLDTGVGIITGAVFLDSNDSGAIDPADAPLVGATVELYRVGESTPLATTLTDSRGAYAFRALDPGSYVVTQVPPSGRKVLANRVTSDVHAISSTTPEAVTVTVRDPASVFVNYGGVVPDQYLAIRTVVGGTPSIDAVGALAGTIGSAPGASDINPGFNTFCLDDLARVPFAGGISFAVVPRAIGDLEVNGATTPISTDHAERIAYIFNHYGNSSLTNFQAAGVQLAIWELLYDEGATPDFTAGNFQVTGAANSGEQALVDQAIAFASSLIAESQGNGESAILLEATAANNPNASGFQSMIGRFGLDFLLTNLPPAAKASISGHVYVDANDNGIRETGEAPIAGVVVRLQGSDTIGTPVDLTTTTDATGFYQFTNLVAGTYTLSETQPTAYDDGKDTQGTPGTGLTENDRFRDVVLLAGVNGVDNDYGELVRPAPLPASISGHVYVDANDNGIRETGEAPIAGVVVRLQGSDTIGTPVDLTTTTDATGFYQFTNLVAGTYTLSETQPTAYDDGKDTQGTPGTGLTENDRFRDVVLLAGVNGVDNDYGELVRPAPLPASISGHVYVDANDNGIRETGEAPIAGVVVRLQGSDTIGTPVDLTTTTDATGFYQFTNLVAGTYTLSETQPTAYDDGKDTQGTPGTGLTENDRFRDVVLLAGVNGVDNDYGELVRPAPLPASISGHVYVDANDNGIRETGEAPIAGVIVRLQGTTSAGQGVDLTTTTDATGFYLFTNLTGGSYTLTETQPSGYIDGKDTQGTPGTGIAENDRFRDIVLPAGINGVDNDFGERLSQPALASISGHVFRDANDNGQRDAGEEGIVGVVVRLHGADETGRVVDQTTTTDLTGFYQFDNLTAGTYTLTETQPKGYVDGKDSQGTPGTGIAENDRFRDIRLTAGTHGVDNDFGEILPAPAVTKLERFGVHQQATTLVLHFDAGLDPRQAIDTANYALVALGRDEKLGTADDRRIPLRSAVYDPAAGTVTLIPAQRLNVHYHYALSLEVPPAAAGASHARYVTVFGRSSLASVTKHNGAVVAPPPLSERDRLRQEHVLKRAEAVIAKHGGLPARSTIRLGHATRVAPATNSARSLGTATRLAPKGPNGQS